MKGEAHGGHAEARRESGKEEEAEAVEGGKVNIPTDDELELKGLVCPQCGREVSPRWHKKSYLETVLESGRIEVSHVVVDPLGEDEYHSRIVTLDDAQKARIRNWIG